MLLHKNKYQITGGDKFNLLLRYKVYLAAKRWLNPNASHLD